MKENKVPTSGHWKEILNEIYNIAPSKICESENFKRNDDNHPLAKRLKIKGQALFLGVSFLQEQGLIEVKKGNGKEFYNTWKLTEKGFNIALENQKAESSERLQEIIALGTVLLALVGFFSFIYPLYGKNINSAQEAFLTSLIFLIFFILIVMIATIFPIIKKRLDKIIPQKD